jgi:hypothetical protein
MLKISHICPTMPRKSIAAILILLALSQIGGAWMVYTTALWVHKTNRESRLLQASKRVQFVLTASEYRAALVEEEEIVIHNRMYDVVSVSENCENVIVIAVPDDAENKLKRTLNELQKESTGWSELANLASAFSITSFIQEPILTMRCLLIPMILTHSSFCLTPVAKGSDLAIEHPPAT